MSQLQAVCLPTLHGLTGKPLLETLPAFIAYVFIRLLDFPFCGNRCSTN